MFAKFDSWMNEQMAILSEIIVITIQLLNRWFRFMSRFVDFNLFRAPYHIIIQPGFTNGTHLVLASQLSLSLSSVGRAGYKSSFIGGGKS